MIVQIRNSQLINSSVNINYTRLSQSIIINGLHALQIAITNNKEQRIIVQIVFFLRNRYGPTKISYALQWQIQEVGHMLPVYALVG